MSHKLIFVYNANSGTKNAIKDTLHKLLKPSTYNCKLCALTYGLVNEKSKWKEFRTTTSTALEFLHADEFEKQYKSKFSNTYQLPVILQQNHYDLEIVMSAETLNNLQNLEELIAHLQAFIKP